MRNGGIRKHVKLGSADFAAIYNGRAILELKISDPSNEQTNEQTIDTLLNRDLLVRIERKRKFPFKSRFVNDDFIQKVTSIKNLATPPKYQLFKNILEQDRFIKEKVVSDTRTRRNSRDEFTDFFETLRRRWRRIADFQKKLKLDLLRKDNAGYCAKCYALRMGKSLTQKGRTTPTVPNPTCEICKNPITLRKWIECLPDPVAQYINGTWFEDYVATKLKVLGWQVWPQIYVYGSSGVKFEIDILAIKSGYSLLVECKTGGVGLRDLTAFLAKFYDIKTNLAVFIALPVVDAQLKGIVHKNPAFKLFDGITNDRSLVARLRTLA